MKTYAPNESPRIEDVVIGEPIFYSSKMEWVVPTEAKGDTVWWESNQEDRFGYIERFTYNPVIPEKPKPEMVECEIPLTEARFPVDILRYLGAPDGAKNGRIVFDIEKGHPFLERDKEEKS